MAELIVAFDVPGSREALTLAGRLPGLRWAKIGPVLFGREGGGPALIKEFTQRGIRVFLDLKWHDIPNIVASAVSAARELGVAMTTVHCLGGRTMLAEAARAAGSDLAVVGVTVLTSHDAAELEGVLGRGVPDVGFEAERLARTAVQAFAKRLVRIPGSSFRGFAPPARQPAIRCAPSSPGRRWAAARPIWLSGARSLEPAILLLRTSA